MFIYYFFLKKKERENHLKSFLEKIEKKRKERKEKLKKIKTKKMKIAVFQKKKRLEPHCMPASSPWLHIRSHGDGSCTMLQGPFLGHFHSFFFRFFPQSITPDGGAVRKEW